ncbi:MAG: class I SAM-dependent methyltransferase [Chloroflexi bacterium]|nr:class I SAM-dependent methyltransferase [Chloroflexota bacterium]
MIDAKRTAEVKAIWDRNALLYNIMSTLMEGKRARTWHTKLWGNVGGRRVLEVGVGTGRSFQYYPPGSDMTAIDLSAKMLSKAKQNAKRAGVSVDLRQMDVQDLGFPENSFDNVVAACTFCSVPDPVQGLQEVRRVLKPEGKAVLLEHMRHDNRFLGKLMDIASIFTVRFMGPALNRRTLENIRKAGFEIETVEDLFLGGILKLIVATPRKQE